MPQLIRFSKKQLLFLKQASHYIALEGIFNLENYDDDAFKKEYGLTKSDAEKARRNIEKIIIKALGKYHNTKRMH